MRDKNTSYFLRFASARRKKNGITCLNIDDGTVTNNEFEISEIAIDYFYSLFTFNISNEGEHILFGINSVISNNDNFYLMERFTDEKIFAALQSVRSTKTLGFDVFLAIFY